MPLLYLIRHPHTQPDPARPASQWGLSAEGHAQVSTLAALPLWTNVEAVFTSAHPKAAVVGQALHAAHGLSWEVIPALNEARRETWLSAADFEAAQRAFFAQPDIPPVPGWETAQEADARFAAALEGILNRYPAASVAVVAHATVLTLYTARLRQRPSTWDEWRGIGFAAIMAVDRATMHPLTPFISAPYAGLPSLSGG